MIDTRALTLLILTIHGILVQGATLYKQPPQEQVPIYRAPMRTGSQLSGKTDFSPDPQAPIDLEIDLENAKAARDGAKSSPHEEVPVAPQQNDNPLDDAHENDLDLELLYDLVRAVEYEANAQLFDKVLQDLDEANYPVPPAAESRRLKPPQSAPASDSAEVADQSQSEPLPLTNAQEEDMLAELSNLQHEAKDASRGRQSAAPLATQKVPAGNDGRGQVTAHGIPVVGQPWRVPLHKRLAAALKDVPQADNPVFPKDGLADKRNMFKKDRA